MHPHGHSHDAEAAYDRFDVQHFERWSQSYEQSWMQRRLFTPVHTAVLDLAASFPAPTDVLDIGCGTGKLLRAAAARWPDAHLIGVDPAEGMVDVARRLTRGATIHRGLAEALPLDAASVDLAFSTLSSHHWGDPAAGLREIARVLRPGGHFILADFGPPELLTRLHLNGGGLSAATRQRIFTAAGLRIERQQGVVYPLILATVAAR